MYNKTVVAAHQPNFFPNLGFFYKMSQVDKFILITNIQFERQEGWQRRNRIPSKNGDIWLTVPIIGTQNQLIKDVKIDNTKNWCKKQKKTLELMYGKTKEKQFLDRLCKLYESNWERLADINVAVIKLIAKELGLNTQIFFDDEVHGEKQDLLINICKKYNATGYLSGVGGKGYMTDEYFEDMMKNNLKHDFIEDDPVREYNYSTVHYILKEGVSKVNDMLGHVKKELTPMLIQ